MATISLEDLEGEIEVIVFTKAMAQVGHKLATDRLDQTGRVDKRDESSKIICLKLKN